MSRVAGVWLLCGALVAAGHAQAQESRFEPNQSRRTAAKIEAGTYGGLVCDGEDWYSVRLGAGQRLLVEASFRHADGDLDVALYDARGRAAGHSRGTGGSERVAYTAARDEPLFVRVFGEANRYALELGVVELGSMPDAGWELEGCGNEWFARQIPKGEAIRCLATARDGRVAQVFVRDSDGNELAAGPAGAVCEAAYTAEAEQRVLVQLQAEGSLRFALWVGRPVPEDLKRVLGKVREEGRGNDLLELHNGDELRGEVVTPSFTLRAAYGELSLARELVAGLDLGTPKRELQRLAAVDGSRFSGFLALERIELRLDGEQFSIPIERVRRVIFARRGKECDGLRSRRMLVLRNDDRFSCALDGLDGLGDPPRPWVVDLGFARRPVDLDGLESIEVVSGDEVKLERPDGGTLRGQLDREYVGVELDLLGPDTRPQRLRLHLSRVAQILPRAAEGSGGSDLEFTFDGSDLEGWEALTDGNSSWSRVAQGEGNGCLHAGGANGGNYADNAGIFATSPLIPIEGIEAPVLSLRARYQLEEGADFVAVLVSYDEGQTFVEVHRFTGTQPWTPLRLPLEAGSSVQVRFALLTDASVNGPGAWIDDVKISDGGE